ncbi:hypothetical protein [Jannaschia sp. R86511]|uniref:hypothetical protein n=1 Tax=Jannaschia sp. R86511 TaxID=3093853 RepID=UPI0036D2CD69
MDEREARLSELMGAALGDDLTSTERAELDELLRSDPVAPAELEELSGLGAALRRHGPAGWDESPPSEDLRRRVLAGPELAGPEFAGPELAGPVRPGRSAARQSGHGRSAAAVWSTRLLVAAALLAVGAAGGAALAGEPAPPTGPPGTLGAVEDLALRPPTGGEGGTGLEVDAALVAHTWGTEAVLEVAGLPAGQTYTVLFVDEAGDEVEAGSFVGVTGAVSCRMTAGTVREDVTQVRVVDASGAAVLSGEVPDVGPAVAGGPTGEAPLS